MKKILRQLPFAFVRICVLLLVIAPSALVFAEEDGDQLRLHFTMGAQGYVSESNKNSAKFEEYREVPRGLVMEEFSLAWKTSNRWFLNIEAKDAAQKDQEGMLDFGRDKYWHVNLHWQENPNLFKDDAVSLFKISGSTFLLPDSLQAAIQEAPSGESTVPGTKAFLLKDATLNGANGIDVGYQRSKLGIGFEVTPNSHWTFLLDTEHEKRVGNQPYPFNFGFTTLEAAIPIDYRTDNVTATVEYFKEDFSAGATALFSKFSNSGESLIFDNPQRAIDDATAPSRGRDSVYPDNDMRQFSIFGTVRLPMRTRITGNFLLGQTKQNDAFLPHTINPAAVTGAASTVDFNGDGVVDSLDDPFTLTGLPRRSLGGRYDTDMFNLRATSQPLDWLTLKAWWRRYERDDKTAHFETDGYISSDGGYNNNAIETSDRTRLNYDYTNTNYGLGARAGQFGPATFGMEYSRQSMTRQHAGVEDTHEDTLKLTADLNAATWLFLRAAYKDQKRRSHEYHSHYYEEAYAPGGEMYVAQSNLGMRKFYWTDRDRNAYWLLAVVTPTEKVSFFGEATFAKSDYFDPNTGMPIGDSYMEDVSDFVDGDETLLLAGRIYDKNITYTLGVSATPAESLTVYADYSWENFDYDFVTRYRSIRNNSYGSDDPADDWGSQIRNSHNTLSFGFNAEFQGEAKYVLNGSFSHSSGKEDVSNWYAPGGSSSGDGLDPNGNPLDEYPTLKSKLTIAMLSLEREIRENFYIGLRWWYENWDNVDWGLDSLQPYMGDSSPGINNGLRDFVFLGGPMRNYENHILTAFVRLSF